MRRYSSPLIWDGRSGSMIHGGHPNGGGGMYLTCTEMMKLGQLYLAEGNWKGRADCQQGLGAGGVHPEIYLRAICRSLWHVGYGYQFWISPYRGILSC